MSDRLRRYLDGRGDQYRTWVVMDAGRYTDLHAEQVLAPPATARNLVGPYLDDHPVVRTQCHEMVRLGGYLTLFVLEVM